MRWVAFSSIFAGLSGYAIILLATQTLGSGAQFEAFNVYWGLYFALHGVLLGIMHETTRAVRAASGTDREGGDPTAASLMTEPLDDDERARRADEGARPLPIAIVIGLCMGALVAVSSPLWADRLLGGDALLGVPLAAVALALVAVQGALFGLLSGSGSWSIYGKLLCVEALARILIAIVAVVSGYPLEGFLFATVAGVLVVPVTLFLPTTSRALRLRADVRAGEFVRRCISAMLAASAAAVLVVGFPVLIKASRPDTDPVVLSNLLLAVTLTRAPILMPITSFQNAIVVYFVDRLARGRRVVFVPIAMVLGLATIGAVLAWLVGPPIIQIMGEGFAVGGQVLAALTFAAGFTGALYVTGSAVLARERHTVYVVGWWIASAVAIAILLLVPGVVVATALALSVGPAIGATVHVLAGMRGGDAAASVDASVPSSQREAAAQSTDAPA